MMTHSYKPNAHATCEPAMRHWIASTFAAWLRQRDLNRTRRILHALPDFALRDIDIHRSEIGGIAKFKRLNNRG